MATQEQHEVEALPGPASTTEPVEPQRILPDRTTRNAHPEYKFRLRGLHAQCASNSESSSCQRGGVRGVLAHRFDQAAGEDGKSHKSSKRKQGKRQQRKRSKRKADKREAPEDGRQVSESGESASGTQRVDTCKAAAAVASAAESLCSHALPPRTVAEALSGPNAVQWQQTIDDETASCLVFCAWESVDLPQVKHVLPSRIVLDRKRDGRYKACLVAGGHRQQQGVDFEETFAPVCSYRSVRMLLAVAAREGLALRQFDIRNAFLNGELKEEVFIRAPAGAGNLAGGSGRVLRLRRALYGLRQAPRAWNQRLEVELRSRGFVQSHADPALWGSCTERTALCCPCFTWTMGWWLHTQMLRLMHWSSWLPPSLRSGPSVSQRTFWASRSAGIMQSTPSPLPRKARPQLSQRSWVCLDAAEYCPCHQRCMQD
jgi:hypothetical protein